MEEILHQLRLVLYPTMYRVFYIPGGAGFLPSTVGKTTGKKSVVSKLKMMGFVFVQTKFFRKGMGIHQPGTL